MANSVAISSVVKTDMCVCGLGPPGDSDFLWFWFRFGYVFFFLHICSEACLVNVAEIMSVVSLLWINRL